MVHKIVLSQAFESNSWMGVCVFNAKIVSARLEIKKGMWLKMPNYFIVSLPI